MKENFKKRFYGSGNGSCEQDVFCGDVNEQELQKENICERVRMQKNIFEQEKNDGTADTKISDESLGEKGRGVKKGRSIGVIVCLLACTLCFLCAGISLLQFFIGVRSEKGDADEIGDTPREHETADKDVGGQPQDSETNKDQAEDEDDEENGTGARIGIIGEDAFVNGRGGVRILSFIEESVPASEMLNVGDVIIAVDGKDTQNTSALADVLSELLPSEKAEVLVERDGHRVSFFVKFVK